MLSCKATDKVKEVQAELQGQTDRNIKNSEYKNEMFFFSKITHTSSSEYLLENMAGSTLTSLVR